MALSDLAVFSEYTYEAYQEALAQQIDLFNAASGGAIVLRSAAHVGDFSDTAFWGRIDGLVRRRNAYGAGNVAEKSLAQIVDTMVKVAAGTPPVRIDPSQFKWIQQNEQTGGVIYGQQLAKDTMADMLNTGLMIYVAAVNGEAGLYLDESAEDTTLGTLLNGAALFGDASNNINGWAMHSKSLFDIFGTALANTANLFSFGTVNVRQDGFGRPFIVTDSPSLILPDPDGAGAGVMKHFIAGMSPNAIVIEQNGDFTQNIETKNGGENIIRTIQSEWSYEMGLKGYSWDKTSGGKSPNDAALATGTNWDRIAVDAKNTAGVLLLVK
jgi:hypothetical protein